MRAANLALRFLLELCALAALGVWGFHAGISSISRLMFAVAAPVLFALLWGALAAPKALIRFSAPARWVLGVVLLELSAVALAGTGRRELALVFAAAVAVNAVLLLVWRE